MRSRSWLRAWKTGRWKRLQSGLTFEPSMRQRGVDAWISSLRATRANRSRSLAVAAASMTNDGSGMRCGAAFATLEPASHSWRTFQATFLGRSDEWSETWPRAGGVSNGTAYRRLPSAPLTDAIASSSWLPTPAASDSNSSRSAGYAKTATHNPGMTLTDALVRGLLPTPTSSEAVRGWAVRGKNAQGGKSLGETLLPTPTTRPESHRHNGGDPLGTRVGGQNGHRLNPQFVEWMMGWPSNWTKTDCSSAETESFHKPQSGRSASCFSGSNRRSGAGE